LRRTALLLAGLVAAGCGNRLVDGSYLGDATIRLHGVLGAPVGQPERARAGVVWLGYEALRQPTHGLETMLLPISATEFPSSFVCDALEAPPSVGRYVTAAGSYIPSFFRVGRLVLFDDVDGDGSFALDSEARVVAPDRLLAASQRHLLLYVDERPANPAALDGADALLSDWSDTVIGYQLVELDDTVALPDLSGHVVDRTTPIVFTAVVDQK
jgi:hypothetical protein